MLRRTVMAAPMRLGWHHVLMVACTSSNTLLMKSRVGSTASASAAPSSPPLQQTRQAHAGYFKVPAVGKRLPHRYDVRSLPAFKTTSPIAVRTLPDVSSHMIRCTSVH
jgi:hypothetical protein